MTLTLTPLKDIPLIRQNDDLADIIINSLDRSNIALEDKDIFVLAQKVVSKAEGRIVNLATVMPSPRAIELGAQIEKDARLVELILRASTIPTSPVKENLFCFFRRIPINPQVKFVRR
jgi:coenzyme F420-0:L-glutamate ligase/coenzyme F420-1:gamma-L-glutamate ligase